jgi:hypothetical protein
MPKEGGTCIRENCIRIADFWKRGWTETSLWVSHIKRTTDGVLIRHANIYNQKTKKIIDVSNGFIKMIDADAWRKSNKVMKMVKIEYPSLMYDGDLVEVLVGMCNFVFTSYLNGDDRWQYKMIVKKAEDDEPEEIFNKNWKPFKG